VGAIGGDERLAVRDWQIADVASLLGYGSSRSGVPSGRWSA